MAAEAMRLANAPRQSAEARAQNMRYAAKFMTLYREHMHALYKYRPAPAKTLPPRHLRLSFMGADGRIISDSYPFDRDIPPMVAQKGYESPQDGTDANRQATPPAPDRPLDPMT